MSQQNKTRDSFFDNYKAFLILCVVIGHFMDHFTSDFRIAEILRIYIYFFHIPAFSFISGYFAKKNNYKVLIQKLLFPYFIFQSIYFIMYTGIGRDVSYHLISPYFTLWYLIALFAWRLVIDHFKKLPHPILLSLIGSILIGFIPDCGDFLSISRIVSFFPFFVMGHFFKKEQFDRIFSRFSMKIGAFTLMLALFLFIYRYNFLFEIPVLNCQDSYESLGQETFGWLFRMTYLPFATCLIYAIGALVPKKQTPVTFLGKYTMRVYLCHGLVYKFLTFGTDVLDLVNSYQDFVIYFACIILLAFALSYVPLEKMMDTCMKPFHAIVRQVKRLYIF